jgi:tetratricopeptide (TPR) repeat protein
MFGFLLDITGSQSLQPKDWFTLLGTALAVTVSFLGYRRSGVESRRSLRKQFTDILQQLINLNIESAKSRQAIQAGQYPRHYARLINDQRRMLVVQASELADRISDQITSFEYLLMGHVFNAVDEMQMAEDYFRRATETDNLLHRGFALRALGEFFLAQQKFDEGREHFSASVDCYAGTLDRFIGYRAITYEAWAEGEKRWSVAEWKKRLQEARDEYAKLQDQARSKTELERIDVLLGASV